MGNTEAADDRPYRTLATSDDRRAWLSARRAFLCGSDVPAALGLSPWRPAVDVWADKTSKLTGDDDDGPVPEYMEIGLTLEPWLRHMVRQRTGARVKRSGVLVASTRWPWLACTLDGTIMPEGSLSHFAHLGPGVLETKTHGGAFADEYDREVPEHERLQADTQMAVTGARWCVFGVLLGGRGHRFRVLSFERDEQRIADLVQRTGAFWREHVLADVPPEPDGSDAAADLIASLYPMRAGAEIIPGTESDLAYALELEAAKATIKAAEERREIADQALRMLIGSERGIAMPDGTIYTLDTVKRAGFTVQPSEYRKLTRTTREALDKRAAKARAKGKGGS